jgi:WD40 repeat protein/serine/threonine protein kinase
MSDNDDASAADPFGQIADEFVEAFRQGQRPSVEEFTRRYPQHADEIREMLPALVLMEKAKAPDDDPGQRHPAQAAAAAPPLSQLGDYQILREVGRGGMGVVYEAQQLSLGRHVAIKVLPSRALLDPRQLGRFQREARSAARLHHTNIVPVFGVGEQDGLHYYVMQFIKGLGLDVVLDELRRLRPPRGKQAPTQADAQGRPTQVTQELSVVAVARGLLSGTFRAPASSRAVTIAPEEKDEGGRMQDEGRQKGASDSSFIPPPSSFSSATIHLPGQAKASTLSESGSQYCQSVARVGMQVADALAHAATQGVLHRDIKPSNLLLDDTGNVWVTDFGLAKAQSDSDDLTHTGDIVGTLRYMAPERFSGPGDLRSDVYSLGLTLYEMLALRPAFDETDRNQLVRRVMHDEPARPRRFNPGVPRDLETVVLKAIARDPAHRYQTPADMAEDLKRFVEDRPVKARRVSEAERFWRWCRRNPLVAGLLAGIVLVFLAGFAGVSWQWREAEAAREDEKNQRGQAETARDEAKQNAKRAEQSRKETASALAVVQAQEAKAVAAERSARAAEEAGRKLLYTTDMQLLPFIWKDSMATAAQLRSRLNAHVPGQNQSLRDKKDLRGFEWYYYQHLLDNSAVVFSGHGASVIDAAFTSNGQLVTLDAKGQVRHRNLVSQAENQASRRDLPGGQSAQVRALSLNGRLAALAEGDKVYVFDTSTGKAICSIGSAGSNPYRHLVFSRDGKRLVIVDNQIRWLSAATGEVIASFDRKFDRVESITLSADGLTLAVVGHDSGFRYSVFRLSATAKTVTPVAGGSNGSPHPFSVCALSPDGQRFVLGEQIRGALHGIVTAPFGYNTWHGSAHAVPVSAIAFSGCGAKVATADTEGTIKVWDARKLTSNNTPVQPTRRVEKYEKEPALLTLKGHRGAITSIHFSGDGKRLVTTGVDKTVRVWDLEYAGAAIRQLEQSGWAYIARFSPDGLLIVDVWEYGRKVILWDAATGRRVRELSAGGKQVVRAAFSPTDNRLLAVGYGRQEGVSSVALWDVDTGAELALLPGATEQAMALAFSPDGKYLVAGFAPPEALKVWEVATRRLTHRPRGHTGYCLSLDFSKDGTLLASGGSDGTAVIWSTKTWKAKRTLRNPDPSYVRDTAFSPDAKNLALASQAGNVPVWDVATGKLLAKLKGHSGAVTAVVFSPDGRTLVSGGDDQTVRLWNVETWRELMQLDSGNVELGSVFTLSFSPDGKHLLAGGWNAVVWSAAPSVWNDPNRAAEKLRRLLNSNADFRNRVRMLSENLRIHAALAKLSSKEVRVRAAVAATLANWHASQERWAEAAKEFDRLRAADPTHPEGWLRMPGLLRLATALLYQNRPADAAGLLYGGAERRARDGLPPIRVKGNHRVDEATGGLLSPLLAAVEKRLAERPRDAGLLELRAEVNRQQTDFARQAADYTAVIQALAEPRARAASARRRRLHRCRGDAYVGLGQWQEAVNDYAQVITPDTTDALLLSNRARAHEALKNWDAAAADWSRAATGNPEGAKLLAELARRLAANGQVSLANATWAKARKWFEEKLAKEPDSSALATEYAQLLLDVGRTREAVPHLAKVSASSKDILLSLKVAALQAWFGQDKELAATRQRILALAKGTNDMVTADCAAKACSIRASTDKAELDAALALAGTAVKLDKDREWNLLALGMAEYRSGHAAAADAALRAAAKAGRHNPIVTGIAAFYRAMSLFRLGKADEGRKLATAAAAKMKSLPKDEQNPLANNAYYDDLILWLAYKEAKAMLRQGAAPPPRAKNDKK